MGKSTTKLNSPNTLPSKLNNSSAKSNTTTNIQTRTDEDFKCIFCPKQVTNSDCDALKCDVCKNWAHSACLKIPKAVTDFFNSNEYAGAKFYFPFICNLCKDTFHKITELPQRMSDFETRLANLELKSNTTSTPSMGNNLDISVLIRDAIEKESKKANAVLFNLSERGKDLEDVKSLISDHNTDSELSPDDIARVFRDGPKHTNKPQFLKVCLTSSRAQSRFISLVNRTLRNNGTGPYPHLRARPDLSFLQRERQRELMTELRNRLASGETDLFVDFRLDCVRKKGPLPNQSVQYAAPRTYQNLSTSNGNGTRPQPQTTRKF